VSALAAAVAAAAAAVTAAAATVVAMAAVAAATAAATAGDPSGGDSSSSRLLHFKLAIQLKTTIDQLLNAIPRPCLFNRQNGCCIAYFITMLPR
jgi:3-oxoacyl-ACP reductase-like protein